MHWQDYVFAVGSFFLIVTLIPMLRASHKPPIHSSLPIAAILYVFAFTYGTLGFALAPIIEFTQATLWLVLVWQRWREDRHDPYDFKALYYGDLGHLRIRKGKVVVGPQARVLTQLDYPKGKTP